MSRVRNPEIYVKGYSKSTTKDDLKNIFRQYGKIICIQYKGPYSFIEFQDYYDAEYAVKEMHDKKIDGGYRLIVEPSGKKKNRRRQRSRSRSKSRYQRSRRRRSSSSSSYSSSSYSSSQSSSYSSSSSSSSVDSDDSRDKKRNTPSPKKQ